MLLSFNQDVLTLRLLRLQGKARSGSQRALTILGFVCKYRDESVESSTWDCAINSETANLIDPRKITWSNLIIGCFTLFSEYLKKEDSPTKCTALRAMGGIFVTQPRLLLQLDQEGLIGNLMADSSGVPLQLESMQCWYNILEVRHIRHSDQFFVKGRYTDSIVVLSFCHSVRRKAYRWWRSQETDGIKRCIVSHPNIW